jgi:hypothetical protein
MKPTAFYKYATASVARINLATQTIRWNSPLNYNDPFDCYFSLGLNFDISQYQEQILDRFVDIIVGDEEPLFDPRNPYSGIYTSCRRMFRAARTDVNRDYLKREIAPALSEGTRNFTRCIAEQQIGWRAELALFRILCVCEEHDNLLLWSHYADCHKGVAFQFECIKELDVPLLLAEPVIYSEDAPAMASLDDWIDSMLGLKAFSPPSDLWHRLTHTKSPVWKAEKEWRVVSQARDYDRGLFEDTPFYPREISKMFLGCRISDEDRDDLIALVSGPFSHVEIFQAYQKPRNYGLDFKKIK